MPPRLFRLSKYALPSLPERQHQLRRIRSRHVDEHGADTAKIGVAVIELQPIRGRPVVSGLTGKDRAGLQTDDCFAAHPNLTGIESIPCDHEHVRAVTGDATVSPNSAASGGVVAQAITSEGLWSARLPPSHDNSRSRPNIRSKARKRSRSQEPMHRVLPAPGS